MFLRKPRERTPAGNIKPLSPTIACEGELWAYERIPPHLRVLAWVHTRFMTRERGNEILLSKYGLTIDAAKAFGKNVFLVGGGRP